MIVKPKIRGFICITSHPDGCAANVQEQIDYVKSQPKVENGPKNVLVIGSPPVSFPPFPLEQIP